MTRLPGRKSNAAAVERTLAELARMGRLETVDAAKVQAARSLAAEVDAGANAATWKVYLAALEALTVDDGDAGVETLLAELRAPVRNPPKG